MPAIRRQLPGQPRDLIEADQQYVDPILAFFRQRFDWLHGEYRMTLKVEAHSVTCEKHYDFTIFEYEADELRSAANDYKYGAGIYWDRVDRLISLGVTIRESQAPLVPTTGMHSRS